MLALLLAGLAAPMAMAADTMPAGPSSVYDCYEPIPGGWRIRVTANASAPRGKPGAHIGVVSPDAPSGGNPRLHRRPLYPPADRSNVFTPEQLAKIERCGFRPLVLAYVEPRFLFDFHSAGGLLGNLYVGLISADGTAKWLHRWSELQVSYIDGRMEYVARDPAFADTTVTLEAIPLANAPGLLLRVEVEGGRRPMRLVWGYGGASAFFTNWAMTAPDFVYQPKHCEKNVLRWADEGFTLTRGFEKTDEIMSQVFAVARTLKEFKAVVQGGSSFGGRRGYGRPEAFAASPAELAGSADWGIASEQTNVVALEDVPLPEGRATGFIAVGMGRNMAEALRNPQEVWTAARSRHAQIAGRVVTRTPDAHLDAAMRMMAFATEGTWGDSAVLHGGWSWRFAYLGWRSWYGMNVYGWTERIAQSIRNHVRLNRVARGPDEGALGSLLEYSPGVYYNMNEVFLDHVRQYFDYTNDLELMREIYPALEGIVAWEERRLRPGDAALFENALNTWISDQHWYIGGECTQASAYMLGARTFLADLARRLGRDAAPHQEKAAAIRAALQQKLWMKRAGTFAEYLDTRGHRLLHPEPELPTLYHAAEFGAADALQIWQMVDWARTHLRTESTPDGGRLYWSSNWAPNMGRSYTHSTYEMAYAEELNFALTQLQVGRADEAWAIERACLAGMFNGPTPGGLACHAYVDGTQRANDEFADAISMWGRATVEGLFGIVPRRQEGDIYLSPQLPEAWLDVEIRTPLFSYQWKRGNGRITIEWTSPTPTALHLRLPLRAASVSGAKVDGQPVTHRVEAGVDLTWVMVDVPAASRGLIDVVYARRAASTPGETTITQGAALSVSVVGSEVLDPQGLLANARLEPAALTGTVVGEPGPGVLFISAGTPDCPYLLPVHLRVQSRTPVVEKRWTRPEVPDRDAAPWTLIDLSRAYNASLPEVMQRVHDAVKPPASPASEVNTRYYQDHLKPPFVTPSPSDEAWRRRIGADGIGWTTDGIPFQSPRQGPNIAVVTRVAVFPASLDVPMNAAGRTLYLMLSGTTFAMQSHVVNLRVTLRYADGSEQVRDLVNPFGIGDCWNQYRFHDTPANGFENLGGRSGPAGSATVPDLTQSIAVDTQAHLVAVDLKPGVSLSGLRIEAIAEDIIFGLMGVSVLK